MEIALRELRVVDLTLAQVALKLFPKPRGHQVAFARLRSVEDALTLFKNAAGLCGPALIGFELTLQIGVGFTAATSRAFAIRWRPSPPACADRHLDIGTSGGGRAVVAVRAIRRLAAESLARPWS